MRPTNDLTGREPLIVVDGVPLTQAELQPMEIDPAQIQEIYILKAPTAVPIYGDRARHGAVIITTRRL